MTSVSGSGYVIENCQTGQTKNVVFDTTSSIQIGDVFRTNYPSQDTCYSVIDTLINFEDWDLVNLPTYQLYDTCFDCLYTPVGPINLEFISVAGGGGGGTDNGGGGGAGGLLSGSLIVSASIPFTTIIGAGGVNGQNSAKGSNGSDTYFYANYELLLHSIGGGGGGYNDQSGSDGGSGGGGGGFSSRATTIFGGSGVPGQGYKGGDGIIPSNGYHAGGSGGGASQSGSSSDGVITAKGGDGAQWIDGLYYAGGGGGVGSFSTPTRRKRGQGGIGGGGSGSIHEYASYEPINDGQINSGGGAGAMGSTIALGPAKGGSGVIKIGYTADNPQFTVGYITNYNGKYFNTIPSSMNFTFNEFVPPSNGYILENCETSETASVIFTDSSSIQLNKILKFNIKELQGCYTISQSISFGKDEWDIINPPISASYDHCMDCIVGIDANPELWNVSVPNWETDLGSLNATSSIQWYSEDRVIMTASLWAGSRSQPHNMFIISRGTPTIISNLPVNDTNITISSNPVSPGSGSAFKVRVDSRYPEAIFGPGPNGSINNYTSSYPYDLNYKDENGITQTLSVDYQQQYEICATEISQSILDIKINPDTVGSLMYFLPYLITKIQDDCL